jgi:hypothetical protein
MDTNYLNDRFSKFAETECKGNSELYYQLSLQIANEPELLQIAANAKQGQPIPNIFFAAIHYLLLTNVHEELAKYYPSINGNDFAEIPFSIFKAFCLKKAKEINEIISTRIVQTNVINRCAYLMPILSKIIAEENKPTTIIDIGTSAGLTLNFDKYEYWYNGQKLFGNSNVAVKSRITGSAIPQIYPISQPIVKIGIDQSLIDLSDEEDILWLKALVWTDQLERFAAIDQALKLDELKRIRFIKGSTVSDFEREILEIQTTENLIICATHVLYQFSKEALDSFYAMLERIGQIRDLYFLSVEGIKLLLERYNSKETVVELTSYRLKQKAVTFLAETNGHGNWIRWNEPRDIM